MPETLYSPPTIQTEMLSVREVATILGMSHQHVYRLVERDELPFPVKRLGGRILIPRRPVMAWLEADEKSNDLDDA